MDNDGVTIERRAFVRWGDSEPPAGFTGVVTYRRPDGTRLAEREYFRGQTWGTCRYFDAADRPVGQELYGTPGYDVRSNARIFAGMAHHKAFVDEGAFDRVRNEFQASCHRLQFAMSELSRRCFDYSFREVDNSGRRQGVDVARRSDGSVISESEFLSNGALWGCTRYYDVDSALVGQAYYGKEHYGTESNATAIDTEVDLSVPTPREMFLSLFSDKKELERSKSEFLAGRVKMLFEHVYESNPVKCKEDFVELLCNIDGVAAEAAQSMDAGEIPEDMDKQCLLSFYVLREHPMQWCTDKNIAKALELGKKVDEDRRKAEDAVGKARQDLEEKLVEFRQAEDALETATQVLEKTVGELRRVEDELVKKGDIRRQVENAVTNAKRRRKKLLKQLTAIEKLKGMEAAGKALDPEQGERVEDGTRKSGTLFDVSCLASIILREGDH